MNETDGIFTMNEERANARMQIGHNEIAITESPESEIKPSSEEDSDDVTFF